MVAIPALPAVTLIPADPAPGGTNTFPLADGKAVERDTTEASLLVSVMNTASAAGDDKDTGRTAVSPGFKFMADSAIVGPEAGAAILVSEKVAGIATPVTDASTVKLPGVELAMNAGEVATPDAFVIAVAVLPPPARVTLAPVEGAVNETITPLSGLLPASLTVAASGLANALLTVALCWVQLASALATLPALSVAATVSVGGPGAVTANGPV